LSDQANQISDFFLGAKILPNFNLKNMNPFLYKGLSMEKIAQIRQILKKKKFPNPPGFKEQKVSQLPDFF